jgi:hypothetical protein
MQHRHAAWQPDTLDDMREESRTAGEYFKRKTESEKTERVQRAAHRLNAGSCIRSGQNEPAARIGVIQSQGKGLKRKKENHSATPKSKEQRKNRTPREK